jgi:hypothetical protein
MLAIFYWHKCYLTNKGKSLAKLDHIDTEAKVLEDKFGNLDKFFLIFVFLKYLSMLIVLLFALRFNQMFVMHLHEKDSHNEVFVIINYALHNLIPFLHIVVKRIR